MFVPHTNSEQDEMLRAIGVEKIDDLFQAVPAAYRFPKLELPEALTEMEVLAEMQSPCLFIEDHSIQLSAFSILKKKLRGIKNPPEFSELY